MKNLRELFTLYSFGFDNYGRWLDHYRKMHRQHPLDCDEFGAEWLRRWEAVGRLLRKLARLEFCERGRWIEMLDADRIIGRTLADLLVSPAIGRRGSIPLRVVLLDGTVVYEWGPK